MVRYKFLFFCTAILVFIFDQTSKLFVKSSFALYESEKLLPILNLTYVENRGIAFGMFHNGGDIKHYILLVSTIIAIATILYLFFRDKNGKASKAFIFGMIIGGAAGNFYDRIVRGYVIDFFDLHLGNHHWPVFNVADSFITIGILLIFYRQLIKKEEIL